MAENVPLQTGANSIRVWRRQQFFASFSLCGIDGAQKAPKLMGFECGPFDVFIAARRKRNRGMFFWLTPALFFRISARFDKRVITCGKPASKHLCSLTTRCPVVHLSPRSASESAADPMRPYTSLKPSISGTPFSLVVRLMVLVEGENRCRVFRLIFQIKQVIHSVFSKRNTAEVRTRV